VLPATEMHAGHLESKVPRVKSYLFCSLQQVATQKSDLHILIFDILITKVTKVISFVPSASLCTRNLNYSSSSLWLVGWLVVLHHQAADSAT